MYIRGLLKMFLKREVLKSMEMSFFEANLEAIGFMVNIELNEMIIFVNSMQMSFVEAILEAIVFRVNIELRRLSFW